MPDAIGKYKNEQCSDLRLGFNWQVNNEIRIEKNSCGFRKHYKNNKCVNAETIVISSNWFKYGVKIHVEDHLGEWKGLLTQSRSKQSEKE